MALSMLVNSLYNIVDSFFVAQISEDAMTALSLVFPIQNFINAVGIGFGVGINAVISLHLGAGQRDEADRAASQGLALSLVHGVVLTVAGIALMPAFLGTVSYTHLDVYTRQPGRMAACWPRAPLPRRTSRPAAMAAAVSTTGALPWSAFPARSPSCWTP